MTRLVVLLALASLLLPAASSPLQAQQLLPGRADYDLPVSVLAAKLDSPLEVTGATIADIGSGRYYQEGPLQVVIRLRGPAVAALADSPASNRDALRRSIGTEQASFLERVREFSPEIEILGRTRLILNSVLAEVDPELIPQLARDPAVLTVRPVFNYELALGETVPYIGAPPLHDLGVDGTGIRVAVVDTGIDYTHANMGGPGNLKAYRAAYGSDPSDQRNTTNDGLFPTAKVIGGFDFIGESWPRGPLAPDPDPIDFNGHGTHVADIIGGQKGVAPGVEFYALKVCAAVAGGCSGVGLLQAMEFAVDPDGDGDPSDHVDIVNMSLGSGYGQAFDDNLSTAVDNATRLGVLTVAAAGNGGNRPYVTGTPAAAETAISVAQTQVPSAFIPTISVLEPRAAAGDYRAAFQRWSAPLTGPIEGPVQYADGSGGNRNGCAPFAPGSMEGKIVVVDRGACFF
ncbi:MAG: S8 family serine peptidase, partial [Dehalococcoidia bacterium]